MNNNFIVQLMPMNTEKTNEVLYCKRINKILPNFPIPVITQLFFDHPQEINNLSWLDYKTLQISLHKWNKSEIPKNNYGKDSTVELFKNKYFNGGSSQILRYKKIGDYILKNGTWPIPPIFLENIEGKIMGGRGEKLGQPYHLIEGHNRLAQILGYIERGVANDYHFVYIMKMK